MTLETIDTREARVKPLEGTEAWRLSYEDQEKSQLVFGVDWHTYVKNRQARALGFPAIESQYLGLMGRLRITQDGRTVDVPAFSDDQAGREAYLRFLQSWAEENGDVSPFIARAESLLVTDLRPSPWEQVNLRERRMLLESLDVLAEEKSMYLQLDSMVDALKLSDQKRRPLVRRFSPKALRDFTQLKDHNEQPVSTEVGVPMVELSAARAAYECGVITQAEYELIQSLKKAKGEKIDEVGERVSPTITEANCSLQTRRHIELEGFMTMPLDNSRINHVILEGMQEVVEDLQRIRRGEKNVAIRETIACVVSPLVVHYEDRVGIAPSKEVIQEVKKQSRWTEKEAEIVVELLEREGILPQAALAVGDRVTMNCYSRGNTLGVLVANKLKETNVYIDEMNLYNPVGFNFGNAENSRLGMPSDDDYKKSYGIEWTRAERLAFLYQSGWIAERRGSLDEWEYWSELALSELWERVFDFKKPENCARLNVVVGDRDSWSMMKKNGNLDREATREFYSTRGADSITFVPDAPHRLPIAEEEMAEAVGNAHFVREALRQQPLTVAYCYPKGIQVGVGVGAWQTQYDVLFRLQRANADARSQSAA